jgi:hypothetical protein
MPANSGSVRKNKQKKRGLLGNKDYNISEKRWMDSNIAG